MPVELKCLLCGHGNEQPTREPLNACSWCIETAAGLAPEEAGALLKLETVKPRFRIWDKGRREESDAKGQGSAELQPARVLLGLPLYIGDMDDASDIQRLKELRIGLVVNLCADRVAPGMSHAAVPSELAAAAIGQLILHATDHREFDMMPVAEQAFGAIDATLDGPAARNGVLVHCWGGVNRSAVVVVAFLAARRGVPLLAAVDAAMTRRGTVLTNQTFRKQLVQYCFLKGLPLEGEVPPALLELPAPPAYEDTEALADACTDRSGRGHRPCGLKDTPIYGLLFAARDGCLLCVRAYVESRSVAADSCSDTRRYTAKDWAEWELEQLGRSGHGSMARKRKLEEVLSYLKQSTGGA